jgi:hypothetical protein
MKVGDIQIDDRGEWVVVGIFGRGRLFRVKRNSLAHRFHARVLPDVAKSLNVEEEVDEIATASESSPPASG